MSQHHTGVRCKHLTELYKQKQDLEETQSYSFAQLERPMPESCPIFGTLQERLEGVWQSAMGMT